MKTYFKTIEFHKPNVVVPLSIQIKIQNIIKILNPIREELGFPIIISKQSGYRPKLYEISRGRSGNSQHCFEGKGAVDLTCDSSQLSELFELLQQSEFTRVCLYLNKGFIHADFKREEKQVFLCLDKNNWIRHN